MSSQDLAKAGAGLLLALICGAGLAFSAPARALAPGAFDPSFGSGGTLITQLGTGTKPSSDASAIALQPDGKLVVAGEATDGAGNSEFLITRLNADGSPDSSFGPGGKVAAQLGAGTDPYSEALAIAPQPDGKLVVAGEASDTGGKEELLVTRLNADGSVDSSFGTGGKVATQLGAGTNPDSWADALVLQPDGKLVLAGAATGSGGDYELLVARLNANGSFDSSFGTGGKLVTQLGAGTVPFSYGNALTLQPDGKLVVAGEANDGGSGQLMVVRLNTDGSFDSSFGTDGKLITQLGAGSDPDSWADALALQPDGKLVVAGEASDTGGRAQLLVARLNADGSLDSSLGTGGKAVTQLGTSSSYSAASYAFALALQPDGKFVVAGKASDGGGHFQFLVARLNADGSIDPSFGTDGKLVTQLGAGTDPFSYAIALARQPDGKLVVAGGASESGGGLRFLVARLTGDEPPAPSFTAPPVAPRLTHVSQSHRRWREARALPRIARLRRAPLGTTFRFSLNEPSRVRFGFSRKLPGRRAGGRCVAVTRRNRHARRCTRSAGAGGLSFSAAAGFHTFRFQGRISRRRKLKPGRYTLTITATGAAGQRATARLAFVIVKS